MATAGTDAEFISPNCRALRERGLEGSEVTVRLSGAALTLADASGRSVAVPAAQVDRLRHFRIGAVHSLRLNLPTRYETKIWWAGGRKPVLLTPLDGAAAYRQIVRAFAGQVAARHGLGRLRLGPGYATAIVNLMIVGPPVLLLFAFMLYLALSDGGWWWAGTAALLLLFAWLAGRNIRARWPRRLASLEQLDAELR